MEITSRVFKNGGSIPKIYTCQGQNIPPPLDIIDVPSNAQTLVLIMEDPDVPTSIRKDGMYDHWILYNISSDVKEITEDHLPDAKKGRNSSGTLTYIGPCPPDREHRYFFKLFALDIALNLPEGATKQEVVNAIQGHIVAQSELMGRYQKE